MFKRFSQALGNVGVNAKLALGFGLMVLLTLLIALTGWHSANNMVERSNKISAIGMGSSHPLLDNRNAENRANNRRVEIIIQPTHLSAR